MKKLILLVVLVMLLPESGGLYADKKNMQALEKKFKKLKDNNLAGQVGEAIDKGVRYLLTLQNPDGAWPMKKFTGRNPGGPTALVLYALVNSKINPKDTKLQGEAEVAIKKGFEYLEKNHYLPGTTYGDAVLIMALEARLKRMKAQPHELYGQVKNGAGANPKKDLEWMRKLTEELLTFKNKATFGKIRAHPKMKYIKMNYLGWGYPEFKNKASGKQRRTDLSNTQYAALGLAAADRAGVKIDREIFMGLIGLGLATQEMRGKTQRRIEIEREVIDDKRELDDEERKVEVIYGYGVSKSEGIKYKKSKKDVARGWGYAKGATETPERAAYGSMTTAGLAMLLCGQQGLQDDEDYKKLVEPFVRKSIYDGIAWLGMTFDPSGNPNNTSKSQDKWTLYYLYGIERVGMMAEVENFGKHLWYRKGAIQLITTQKKTGAWSNGETESVDTCFALLFLSRSTQSVGFIPDDKPPKPKYDVGEEKSGE